MTSPHSLLHRLPVALLLFALATLNATPARAESGPDGMPGEKTFRIICQSCHLESLDLAAAGPNGDSALAAPPMDWLSTAIRMRQNNDEAEFVGHVVSYLRLPSVENSLLPGDAIARHGVMPPISEYGPDLTYDDLTAVASWIYGHYNYKKLLPQLQKHLQNRQASPQ